MNVIQFYQIQNMLWTVKEAIVIQINQIQILIAAHNKFKFSNNNYKSIKNASLLLLVFNSQILLPTAVRLLILVFYLAYKTISILFKILRFVIGNNAEFQAKIFFIIGIIRKLLMNKIIYHLLMKILFNNHRKRIFKNINFVSLFKERIRISYNKIITIIKVIYNQTMEKNSDKYQKIFTFINNKFKL